MPDILLVDDDVREHELVNCFLHSHYRGTQRLTATTRLEDALQALRTQRYDAILLDNMLRPYGDARQNAPVLRAAAPHTPIFIISVAVDDLRNVSGGFLPDRVQGRRPGIVDGVVDKFSLKHAIADGLFDGRGLAFGV